MRDDDLDAFLDLARIPSLPFRGVHARPQNCGANSFLRQNSLEMRRDVMLLRVDREHLTSPSFGQFFSDIFDELPFFGMEMLLGKIVGIRNHEANVALEFRVELGSVEG